MYRDFKAGELSKENVNLEVRLAGWVHSIRDHGNLVFIDIRDRSGIAQVVFNSEFKGFNELKNLRSEYVISVVGKVRERSSDTVNKDILTGDVELVASDMELINRSQPPIFEISDDGPLSEAMKMEHRYLYFRRESNLNILKRRSQFFWSLREELNSQGFMEVDTPILTKSTPEGARDFLVPSRLSKGKFYALPQSPQIFKQLLMVAGVEKYYQIAKCFRDEDLRADRQPEFMQLDMEISFAPKKDIMTMAENLLKGALKSTFNVDLGTVPIMTYKEVMDRYGSDKPDLRYDLEIIDLSDISKESGFSIFKKSVESGGVVRAINAKGGAGSISRKDIDDLTKDISVFGAKGLAWIKINEDGSYSSVITKFFKNNELIQIIDRVDGKPNDIIFFVADQYQVTCESLGLLRTLLASKLQLVKEGEYRPLWVVDFPLFEWGKEEKRLVSKHNPFTRPTNYSNKEDLKSAISDSYDFVLNGHEIAGGGLRIHCVELQKEIFEILGLDGEEAENQFGHLLKALRSGAPPHGGIAFGLDRILAIFLNADSIRDVIPFPKTQKGQCLLTVAPSEVDKKDLLDLGISVDKKIL